MLRLRLSNDGSQWFIERKCSRESLCLIPPRDKQKWDDFVRNKDGYTFVAMVPRSELGHHALIELRAHDMWQTNRHGWYADFVESQEAKQEQLQDDRQSSIFQAKASEMYDKLAWAEGRRVGMAIEDRR